MDRGRLAGPVRAEEAVDLTRGDAEIDPVDRAWALAELPDQALGFNAVISDIFHI
jgi:hypothetical protein